MNIRAFVPRYLPNRVLVYLYSLAACIGVRQKDIRRNREQNERELVQNGERLFARGTHYIEQQPVWRGVLFGKKSNIGRSGCGVIAAYNALLAFWEMDGRRGPMPDILQLISAFERRGAACGGKYGVAPRAIARYFRRLQYDVTEQCRRDAASVNALGEYSDVVIVTVYNDVDDLRRMLHTVCITKKDGIYNLHNASPAGEQDAYNTLWEAILHISNYQVGLIALTGLRRRTSGNGH